MRSISLDATASVECPSAFMRSNTSKLVRYRRSAASCARGLCEASLIRKAPGYVVNVTAADFLLELVNVGDSLIHQGKALDAAEEWRAGIPESAGATDHPAHPFPASGCCSAFRIVRTSALSSASLSTASSARGANQTADTPSGA